MINGSSWAQADFFDAVLADSDIAVVKIPPAARGRTASPNAVC
jgi:hypothetical protein